MNIEDSIRIAQGLAPVEDTRRSWLYVICCDGVFYKPDTKLLGVNNSFFTTGYGFRLTLSLKGSVPYLWREQCIVIQQCISLLSMPEDALPQWDVLYRQIELLAAKNHYPGHSQVILSVWMDDDRAHYSMQQCRLDRNVFEINTEPVFLVDYDRERLPDSPYNCIPRPSLIHYMAERYVSNNELKYHGALLRDSQNRVVQSTLGNVYILIDDDIYTTSPKYGALLDPMKDMIEFEAVQQGLHVVYIDGLTADLFSESTECFVASNEFGIHLVVGAADRRFKNDRLARLAVYLKQRLVY